MEATAVFYFLCAIYEYPLLMDYRYDMEDAMILNKSSVERGMFHGQIYQV